MPHRLTDAERRALLLEHLLDNRISRADYDRATARLNRRRGVLTGWLWLLLFGYVTGAMVVAIGGFYAFIILIITIAEGGNALVGGL